MNQFALRERLSFAPPSLPFVIRAHVDELVHARRPAKLMREAFAGATSTSGNETPG
jgi:hypothetical protein